MATLPPVAIRKSQRAKRLRLVVRPGGAELVIPESMSEAKAMEFLKGNRQWLEQKFREMAAREIVQPQPQCHEKQETLLFQGQEVPLTIQPAVGRKIRVEFNQGFIISVPDIPGTDSASLARTGLLSWAKIWLQAEVWDMVNTHGPRHGLLPREIRIKKMTTRWGSCGPRNDININVLLAFTPPAVLEYVVVHEICHIRHRNHSASFWNLVGNHLPEYSKQRLWLKLNGADLLRRFP